MTQLYETMQSTAHPLTGRVRLSEVIVASAHAALQTQAADGSFPAGWNGPYHDQETPTRNTAHWLIMLLKAYTISSDVRFRDNAWRAVGYLTSTEVRPMRAAFYCRVNPEKDFANRLIGQAWVIEALVAAAEAFDEPSLRALAAEVFLLHPFMEKAGLWRYINVDGSYVGFDPTFNHQLMFAAAGALIENDPKGEIGRQIAHFLQRLKVFHLRAEKSGRITHRITEYTEPSGVQTRVRRQIETMLRQASRPPVEYRTMKEIGYHAFNLYGFCILKQRMPNNSLWATPKFQSVLHYIDSAAYVNGLENNKYGFPYNPAGIEAALTQQVFASSFAGVQRSAPWWVEQQLRRHFNRETSFMDVAADDPNTLAARLYEAVGLNDLELELV